ncbi:nucleotidyltransferase [Oceaniovalibus sp. ACAM 378]|uniref:nucleotidyltransferase domain-containing protein n=1 Tax=Oceaniovalibus sp. ACAM 378 TaxID=2599923 RepID=UPI0011DBFB14|nr:nucleotidyltransferase [Oceaniovalibus sp. ACAM 378]TYB83587.1 nucleotidyltransferase [Oceaniovalibus sp. ACAM 378]
MNSNARIGYGYNVAIEKLAEELAVPQDRFDQAEKRYKDLGEFLHRDESKVRDYDPDVYIQGSFALGTPIKPATAGEDYDLDIVVSFRSLAKGQISQADLRARLRTELEAYRKARGIQNEVGESRRCCTLLYADGAQFHMDVLPAIPNEANMRTVLSGYLADQALADGAISITDSDNGTTYRIITNDWPRSNPRGFASWFKLKQIAQLNERRRAFLDKQGKVTASVEDVPVFRVRTPLQSAIMILKRHRDEWFAKHDPDLRVISVILTTLSTHAYTGEARVSDAIGKILRDMHLEIYDRQGVSWIANPTDPSENFADRWEEFPKRREAFFSWLEAARAHFGAVQGFTDANTVLNELAPDLGNQVVEAARLRVSTNSGSRTASVAPAAAAGVSAPGLVFGDEDRRPTEPKGFG